MAGDPNALQITALVDAYLTGGATLADYLRGVDPALRTEVGARCEEAAFIESFFGALPPLGDPGVRPDRIGGCELLEMLGEGAMGEVFRARQADLGREVAVKLVRGELCTHGDFLARFRNEAQLLARLDHPGIVKVLTCGVEQGWHYIVMELVRGQDLLRTLPRLRAAAAGADARAAHDRIARIVAELLETLAYAHGLGIVHRDLKPSNVVLDAAGHPRLVDFGLAKAARTDAAPGAGNLRTLPGLVLGTPAYLCPEVAANRPCRPEAADLWAAAAMLHQLVTGELPYPQTEREQLFAALATPRWIDPRADDPAVPAPLAAICRRALAPEADDRYPSAQAFAADLRRFLAREPVDAERRWSWQQAVRHLRRRRRRYLGAAGVAAAIGATWLGADAAATAQRATQAAAELLRGDDVERAPLPDLARRALRARELLAAGELDAADRAAVAALRDRIEARARQEHAAGLDAIVRGGGAAGPVPTAPSAALQMEGVQRATAAATVDPALASGPELLARAHPVLAIEDPDGRSAVPLRIDALEPIHTRPELTVATGATPFAIALPPGCYRVVVGDADAFAEIVSTLSTPGRTAVRPRLVPTGVATRGMLRIQPGSAVVGSMLPTRSFYPAQTIRHGAFFIDRTEVTCGQYRDYLLATGEAPPRTWAPDYDPAWHDLPVAGVTPAEAMRYAAWCGKRLPTHEEWQIAARGVNGFLFPWGDDQAPTAELPTIGRDRDVPWFAGVRAAGTTPLDTSWCGAMDMLGNVDEWTASVFVENWDGMPFPVWAWHMRAGGNWNRPAGRFCALDAWLPGQPGQLATGFRCAKSAGP